MPYDPEEAKREAEESKKGGGEGRFSEIEYLKFEVGENRFRILPVVGERKVPWVKGKVAHNLGSNGKRMVRPKFDDLCPLKKYLDDLYSKGDAVSKERADASWPKNRVWMWVVPRAPHPQAGKRCLYECDIKTWPDIAGIFADPEYGYIADPTNGRDIKIIYTPADASHGRPFPIREVRTAASNTPLGTAEEIAAWTAKDWFDEYEIGVPMDPGYIKAVVEGKEEEWKAAKKAENDAKKAASGGQGEPDAFAPPPPATIAPPMKQGKVILGSGPNEMWHFFNKSNGLQSTSPALHAEDLLLQNQDFMMCRLDGVGGWQPPDALGFKIEVYAPPPVVQAPVAPPAPAAPPPPAPATPPPPVAPHAPIPAPKPEPKVERKFWVSNNGAVTQKTETEVIALVQSGWQGPVMLEGESAWKTNGDYGIVQKPVQASPGPPPAPMSAAPPMPPSSNGSANAAQDALQKQIDALRAAQAGGGPPNPVMEALRK